MTPKQYQHLLNLRKDSPQTKISGKDLKNQKDRTLIYGYTLERNTFHVYLKDGVIHKYIFKNNFRNGPNTTILHEEGEHFPSELTPSKRAYPDCCDFTFCKLLHDLGVNISFTTNSNLKDPTTTFVVPIFDALEQLK